MLSVVKLGVRNGDGVVAGLSAANEQNSKARQACK